MSSSTGATTFDGSASDPVAVLREVDALLTALAEPGLWTVADAELLRLTCAAESTRRKVEALRLGIVAEVSARDLARQAGARSTSEWLVQKTRVGRAEARRTVRAAERLSAHAPKVRDELAAGGIGLGHASAIADVMAILHSRANRFQSPVTYDVLRAAEATLLDLAATLDPAQLATAGTHLIDRVDPDWNPFDSDDAVLAQEAQREFTCTPLPDGGTRFSGGADPEGRAIIEAALSPLSAPRPTTAEGRDRRSPAQRRGEALVELCRRQLDAEDQPTEGGGAGTTVFATCTLEHLQGQLAEADPTLDFGTTIALESLRRLACDAWIIPAVLATTSQPLDIGRASRTVPLGLRRALIARDRQCAFPGCGLPPAWCDAHHIVFWSDGGDTALHNLVLLCGHHHRLIHHSEWQIVLAADGLPSFIPPSSLDADIVAANPAWRVLLQERFPRQPRAG